MPKYSSQPESKNKQLKLKLKTLQKKFDEIKSHIGYWKTKYEIANEYLKKARTHSSHTEREREKERDELLNEICCLKVKHFWEKSVLETTHQSLLTSIGFFNSKRIQLVNQLTEKEQEIQSQKQLTNKFQLVKKEAKKWKNTYQSEQQNHQQTQNRVRDLENQLKQKEQIIQAQDQKIRELTNKPPLVETKTQTVEKIVEKPVEKLIEIESSTQKQEIAQLKTTVKCLEEQLANRPAIIKTNSVASSTNPRLVKEVWILRGLLIISILIFLFSLVQKKKKKKSKLLRNSLVVGLTNKTNL